MPLKLSSATIEQVADGLILVDQEGSINHANAQAKSLLHLDDSVQGRFIGEVLRDENGTFSSIPLQAIAEKEIMLDTNEGFKRYYISVRTFEAQNDAAPLGLITIKASAYARKLTNSVNASYAKFDFSNIIGRSAKINDAVNMAKIASKSTSTVLITGPSGTGKELFAHAIHSASSRSDGPFVSINCGALPANLVESELFGYEGGSFTGSRKNGQMGKFELADHGTLFLDEIGEMPLSGPGQHSAGDRNERSQCESAAVNSALVDLSNRCCHQSKSSGCHFRKAVSGRLVLPSEYPEDPCSAALRTNL